jgi:hypothetical protein
MPKAPMIITGVIKFAPHAHQTRITPPIAATTSIAPPWRLAKLQPNDLPTPTQLANLPTGHHHPDLLQPSTRTRPLPITHHPQQNLGHSPLCRQNPRLAPMGTPNSTPPTRSLWDSRTPDRESHPNHRRFNPGALCRLRSARLSSRLWRRILRSAVCGSKLATSSDNRHHIYFCPCSKTPSGTMGQAITVALYRNGGADLFAVMGKLKTGSNRGKIGLTYGYDYLKLLIALSITLPRSVTMTRLSSYL